MQTRALLWWAAADEVNAVVLDLGTWQCRAGYAGDDTPKAVFPSVRYTTAAAAASKPGSQPGWRSKQQPTAAKRP